ncbi:uncharacterized protein LOC112680885 [Sipha flava]|uniref:Trimethylguanosine synthase n=1 Tax=Sipha flava TaxID=143950 RepID=A0A8B8F808_9HEMI|nr:uncharacterized protein LOC112680885 [Sipha flava]
MYNAFCFFSSDHRCASERCCSSDATTEREIWHFMVFCVICGWPKIWTAMTEDDYAHRGFAHRRCIAGALRWGRRDGRQIHVDRLCCPKATAETVTQTDEVSVTNGDSVYRTPVATRDVACGHFEISYADGYTQASPATSDAASGDQTLYVDKSAQVDVTMCQIASGVDVECVNGPARSCNVMVEKRARTMADEMAQLVDAQITLGLPAALAPTADSTSGPSMEYRSSKAETQPVCTPFAQRYWHSILPSGALRSARSWTRFVVPGGNVIQLALICDHVIAIDLDPKKIALAKKNAEVYGVAHRIDFRVGNSFSVATNLRVDAVVTSPPWGGPGYERRAKFDARDLCGRDTGGMAAIIRMARAVAPRVVLHVPKNIDKDQCLQIAMDEGFSRIQYESVSIDKKPNCLNLYLTRNDTHARGIPVQTLKSVQLDNPSLNRQQKIERLRTENKFMYMTYLNKVARFFETNHV